MTAPLNALLSLLHAFDWMDIRDRKDRAAYLAALGRGVRRSDPHRSGKRSGFDGGGRGRAFLMPSRNGTETRRRGTVSELAGCVPRRVVGLGEGGIARRLRCCGRQPALGPDETAAGSSGSRSADFRAMRWPSNSDRRNLRRSGSRMITGACYRAARLAGAGPTVSRGFARERPARPRPGSPTADRTGGPGLSTLARDARDVNLYSLFIERCLESGRSPKA